QTFDDAGPREDFEFLVTNGETSEPVKPQIAANGNDFFVTWQEQLSVLGRTARFVDPVVCGDATLDGSIVAGDALLALQTAVGTGFCRVVVCDVNAVPGVTAADALQILRVAVGLDGQLTCPSR